MKTQKQLIKIGSNTAKNGFKNETYVADEFNKWVNSECAQEWLTAMAWNHAEIENVNAEKVKGFTKTDIQVRINLKELPDLPDIQNVQVKLVSNPVGFNQIDKRWLKKYKEIWSIPEDVYTLLQHFTGELKPYIKNPRDKRRMFADEFNIHEQNKLLEFFNKNKDNIISDILRGKDEYAAEWMLVILKVTKDVPIKSKLVHINDVIRHFSEGEVCISPRGSFKLGRITIQRKGGDGGKPTANMLQFKINPAELIF